MKDFDHFTDHSAFTSEKTDPILGLNLFSLKGQKWREMRSALSPAYTGSKMRSMFTLISKTAENFTSHFWEKSESVIEVEMKDICTKYTNDVIANCAFGIECNSLISENEFYKMGSYVSTPTPWRLLKSLLYGFFPKIFEVCPLNSINKQSRLVFPNSSTASNNFRFFPQDYQRRY